MTNEKIYTNENLEEFLNTFIFNTIEDAEKEYYQLKELGAKIKQEELNNYQNKIEHLKNYDLEEYNKQKRIIKCLFYYSQNKKKIDNYISLFFIHGVSCNITPSICVHGSISRVYF